MGASPGTAWHSVEPIENNVERRRVLATGCGWKDEDRHRKERLHPYNGQINSNLSRAQTAEPRFGPLNVTTHFDTGFMFGRLVGDGSHCLPTNFYEAGKVLQFSENGGNGVGISACWPAYFAIEAPLMIDGVVDHGEGFDAEVSPLQARTEIVGCEAILGDGEHQLRALIALDVVLERAQSPKGQEADYGGDGAEDELASAEAETDHGSKPEGGRGGEPCDHFAFAQNGASADESDAGQDSERKAHQVHYREGIRRLAVGFHQQVHLDHGNRCSESDEKGGSQAGRMAGLAALHAEQTAGKDGENETQRDLLPMDIRRHAEFG